MELATQAMRLNGLYGKNLIFINFLQLYLCICLFLYALIYIFYYNFKRWKGSSLSFINQIASTLGCAADKLLNGLRVNSHRQFIFGNQSLSLSLFRGITALQENQWCNFSHFLDMVKTALFLTFLLLLFILGLRYRFASFM